MTVRNLVGFTRTLVFMLLFLSADSYAGDIESAVEKVLRASGYPSSSVGFMMGSIEHDSVIATHNGENLFVPASVTKLVTGALALERLGPDHTYETKVYIDGTHDRDKGVVNGDMYILGGGDPGLFAERLWLFSEQLYHLGVRKITGDIILEESLFDSIPLAPGYGDDGTSRAYLAPVGALSASFNCVAVHVRPGAQAGSPVHIDLLPALEGVRVVNTAKTVSPGKSTSLVVRTEPNGASTQVTVYGGMSTNSKPRYIYRKAWSTGQNFAMALQALFERNQVVVEGSIQSGSIPKNVFSPKPFHTFKSQPLSEFVEHMFKYSSNFAAEMVYKSLSASYDSSPGSWEKTSEIARNWWQNATLPDTLRVRNGSGMGSVNQLSPNQIVSLLGYVWSRKEYLPEYLSALSVAGVDGTLKSRFKYSPLRGIIRAKTGTLNESGVSTLSGYVLLPRETLAFAVLVNHTGKGQYSHWKLQQELLETVVKKYREADSKRTPADRPDVIRGD